MGGAQGFQARSKPPLAAWAVAGLGGGLDVLFAKLVEQEVVDKPHLARTEAVAHRVVDVGNGGVIQQLL